MPPSLPVRLNHDRLHDIQTRASFETTDSFLVTLQNGNAPVHVHLHLDDDLSSVASIAANNHFVDADSTREVPVEIADGPRPVEGRLKIVTGHGAETDYVTVSVVAPEDREDAVSVDETLATPSSDGSAGDGGNDGSGANGDDGDSRADRELPDLSLGENAPVVALGLLAVAVAAGATTISNSVVVLFGVLAVLGSVVAAAYLLTRGK